MDTQKSFLMILIGILSFAAWLMVKPFLTYILFALILGFLLQPLQKRISGLLGKRISAVLLMVFAFVAAVVPVGLATVAVAEDARELSDELDDLNSINVTAIEDRIKQLTGQNIDLKKTVDNGLNEFTDRTFGSFSRFVNLFVDLSIGLTLMVFLLYYFLKDGDRMVKSMGDAMPLDISVKEGLIEKVENVTWAVIKGHVLVAVLQGLVAGIGLYLAGISNVVFWTFVMVVLGFIPLIGTVLVWGPASIYLFMIDKPMAALFLAVYGAVVVGLTDNIVRPIVVDRAAKLHPAVVLIGVLGGVYLFGATGLFFGPILLGVLKAAIVVFIDEEIN